MTNYDQPTVFNCPNCGSSIALQGQAGTCAYCGTAVSPPRNTTRTKSNTTSWSVAASSYPTGARYQPRRGVHPLLALLLAIIAAGGGFLAGRALPAGVSVSPSVPQLEQPIAQLVGTAAAISLADHGSVSELAALLPRDGKGSDMIAYVYHSDSSRYTLALIDGGTHTARWHSPPLSKEAYQGRVALGPDMLYFTDKDQLFALHLRDGAPAWQAALTVEPSPGCDECLRVLNGRVAVLEKDGSLQVFDAQSGQLAWAMRLAERPSRLPIVGDTLLTLTKPAGGEGRIVSLLEMGSGKPARQIAPECPPDPDMRRAELPDSSSPFLFSADGKTMYTVFGFFAQCAQAWDVASGEKHWQAPLSRDFATSGWSSDPPLVADKAIFSSGDKQIWALDTANGATRVVLSDKEYNLKPLALHNNILIVRAAPEWDSQRQELWGVDSASGERRWQVKLLAHNLREGHSSGDWEWRLTPKRLLVIEVLPDQPRLKVSALDPQTGASLLNQETPLDDRGSPSMIGTLWGDDTAWLRINGDVLAIDLASGKVDYRLE